MSRYKIYRRENGPFRDWHYVIYKESFYGKDIELGTAFTLIGARRVVSQDKKASEETVLTHVESW